MENTLLLGLPAPRNEKLSFFGIDILGDPTSSLVFVSEDMIYCSNFKHNYSGYMGTFTIFLSMRKGLRFICNLKSIYLSSYLLKHQLDLLGYISFLQKLMTLDVGHPRHIW